MSDPMLEPTPKQLKIWQKGWRKFHRSLPDVIIDPNGTPFMYRESKDSGSYTAVKPAWIQRGERYKLYFVFFLGFLSASIIFLFLYMLFFIK